MNIVHGPAKYSIEFEEKIEERNAHRAGAWKRTQRRWAWRHAFGATALDYAFYEIQTICSFNKPLSSKRRR